MQIRGVLFDFDHTLGVDNKIELTTLRDTFDTLQGDRFVDGTRFMEDAHARFERIRRGEVPIEAAMTEQFRPLSGGNDAEARAMAQHYLQTVVDRVPLFVKPEPGACELLRDLRWNYKTAIVTNGWTRLQERKAAHIGFEGPVFTSEAMGRWKPDARAFYPAITALSLQPAHTLYVGDNPAADVAGAHGAGLVTVWVNEKGQPYPQGLVRPDFEVHHVAEVRDILAGVGGVTRQ